VKSLQMPVIATVLALCLVTPQSLRARIIWDSKIIAWCVGMLYGDEAFEVAPASTTISDHFGSVPDNSHWLRDRLALSGAQVATPAKGSLWVYDPLHHIVAASSIGDESGDLIVSPA
jgi:hypothetical protein